MITKTPIAKDGLSPFQIITKELEKHNYKYIDLAMFNEFMINKTMLIVVKVKPEPEATWNPSYKIIDDFPYRLVAIKPDHGFLKEIDVCLDISHAWQKMDNAIAKLNKNQIL